jgi:hypothetical protein
MSRSWALLVAASVAAGALLAGCGGSGETLLYKREPTRRCLVESDLKVRPYAPASDFVARTASGGALRVLFVDQQVTLTFDATEEGAQRTEKARRRFAPKSLPIDDVLKRDRNVVELWTFSPTIDQQEILNRCLQA